jgi:uncharacterized protein YkwD
MSGVCPRPPVAPSPMHREAPRQGPSATDAPRQGLSGAPADAGAPSGAPAPAAVAVPRTSWLLRSGVVLLALAALATVLTATPARAADDWLGRINEARTAAGLGPVRANAAWGAAGEEHARYLVLNRTAGHHQDPSRPGHTPSGQWAGRTGNVLVGSEPVSPVAAVEYWLDSPPHARWLLHWAVGEAGYGAFDAGVVQRSRWAAVLPIVAGYDATVAFPGRYRYPGDGASLRVGGATDGPGTRALHVFGTDLPPATELTAGVTVGGQPVAVSTVASGGADHVAIVLASALPVRDARVAVTLRRGTSVVDQWSFTTNRTATRPPSASPSSVTPTPDAAVHLTDVAGTTHADSIRRVVAAGIAQGHADGTFRPGRPVTRGQMAAFLTRALRLSDPGPGRTPLRDVDGSTHQAAIRAVVAAGIAQGHADGTFRPSEPVTRGQMATFLTRALRLSDPGAGRSELHDVAGSTHRAAIRAVVAAEIAHGHRDGTFRPGQPVTRGQLAAFLTRALRL